jgi:hypothetical protein
MHNVRRFKMFNVGDKVTYQLNKKTRGNAVVTRISTGPKKGRVYIKTETEGTLLVYVGELVAR